MYDIENNLNGKYFHHHFYFKTGVSRNGLPLVSWVFRTRYKQCVDPNNDKIIFPWHHKISNETLIYLLAFSFDKNQILLFYKYSIIGFT